MLGISGNSGSVAPTGIPRKSESSTLRPLHKHNYQELQKETKSFSQMVWLSTRKVGFGKAKSPDGKWYGCAHYYPEGNIVGLFRTNVLPLQQSF